MPTSRRNMIVGLGALTVGGGALIGSGAFGTTEAQRGLEVDVITGEDIASDALDVQIDPDASDSVEIEGVEDTNNLFPIDETAVSLVENDVTVSFGTFLGSSTTVFEDFFSVINEEGSDTLELTLETDGDVFEITQSESDDAYENVEVEENSTDDDADLAIDTGEIGDEDDENETLTITIVETEE